MRECDKNMRECDKNMRNVIRIWENEKLWTLDLKLKVRKNIPFINEKGKNTQNDVSKCLRNGSRWMKNQKPLRTNCPVNRTLLELTGEAEEIAEWL